MAKLLHLDSSLNGDASHSRAVTAAFRAAWESEHPGGTVVYRDLAAEAIPHLAAAAYYAGQVSPAEHSPEQKAAFELRGTLIQEAEEADAILIGAPMYNYTISSTLKAWLDHVVLYGRTVGTPDRTLAGKPTTVVASRGGSYAPGTPREGVDYVQPYLEHLLAGEMGLDVHFIIPELTLAPVNPAMADLIPLAEASRAKALEEAESRGKQLARQLSA
ncbi:FMN-dependent NADH-azoreductase [Wenjunlia vitaminophila]|uniref:FMN dependent NADH:quinone oxidoreductase n=1 Tax=Wenjunlia vitaminophila TaxID=76728 RepID=A0A0T6LW85_WENVI|nr:NAD(P)H-dependent oxidoreductase [Wenjunlia vitaminophila]KRV50423.1 FMN-dependent NADH-azoreductase [Wenjunlia vitaminophila]